MAKKKRRSRPQSKPIHPNKILGRIWIKARTDAKDVREYLVYQEITYIDALSGYKNVSQRILTNTPKTFCRAVDVATMFKDRQNAIRDAG